MTHPAHESPVFDGAGDARVLRRAPARERWSWALFDFANTIFSMNVTTLYLGVWLVSDLGATNTTYALASALSSVLVVVSIPLFGAISDAMRRRKWWVVGFTIVSCAACAAIGIAGQTTVPLIGEHVAGGATSQAGWSAGIGELKWVLLAFIIANYAYQAALPFYNAMLPELVPPEEQGRMSGTGVAVGYVGLILGLLMVAPFFTAGLPLVGDLSEGTMSALRSIPFADVGGRVSTFVPTALLFLLFTLPFVLFCHDHDPVKGRIRVDWRGAFRQVANTLRDARQHPGAVRFIVTTFVYQDAVGTIIGFTTLYAVKAVGFEGGSVTTLFLVLTIPAIFGSYFYGRLADRIGPRRALSATIGSWVIVLIAMIALPGKTAFWIVGLAIGFNYGGVNATERPVLLSLIPDAQAGRYFSLLLLSSRAAAIAGPLVWSLTVDSLEGPLGTAIAYRIAVSIIVVMFAIAWLLLRGVPDRRPGAAIPA